MSTLADSQCKLRKCADRSRQSMCAFNAQSVNSVIVRYCRRKKKEKYNERGADGVVSVTLIVRPGALDWDRGTFFFLGHPIYLITPLVSTPFGLDSSMVNHH